MGEYVVNGEVVSVEEARPTPRDLKQKAGAQPNDWVMATLPGNKVLKVEDHETLPADAIDYSIVAPFTYGQLTSRGATHERS
jgi:hypothetical protein